MNAGNAKGYIRFSTGVVVETEFPINDVIHNALQNYLFFSVGNSGTQFKQVPNFNG